MRRFASACLGLFLLVGCSGSSPAGAATAVLASAGAAISAEPRVEPATDDNPRVAGPAVPKPFEALFEQGREWNVRVTNRSQFETDPPETTVRDSVCRVVQVQSLSWGTASEIDCPELNDDGVAEPLGGFWVATDSAVYHLPALPKDAAGLDPAALRFSLPPAPRSSRREDDEGGGEEIVVEAKGAGWCHRTSYWGGDEAWFSVCVEAGAGFTSASWGWAGGSVHENTLEAQVLR